MGINPFEKEISDRAPPLRRGFPDEFATIIWMFPWGIMAFIIHVLCATFFMVTFVRRDLGGEHLRLVALTLQPFLRDFK